MRRALIFALFFTSGAAGLMYEVTWARSLGLVFGASHLAVTTVLAVYMGGQALGGFLFGGRADRATRPLRLYAVLELGVGLSAPLFIGLMHLYPSVYGPLARLGGGPTYLTLLRTCFAVAAMAVPTTLMGGTLPVLVRFVSNERSETARSISSLYALNTLGAVAGVLLASFALLRAAGVTATLLVAAALSVLVFLAALALDRTEAASPSARTTSGETAVAPAPVPAPSALAVRLTLAGIGISGFCALGYEVLWTRMLTLVVGTSVYAFAIMLVAFLTGIGVGSHAFGVLASRFGRAGTARAVIAFGATQVAIGVTALTVTLLMRDLPAAAQRVQGLIVGGGGTEFGSRLIASATVALAFLFVPAFFMGLAFPAAGAVWSAAAPGDPGRAVGRLVTANTVGAILGSVVSGFALIYLFGIERSLQMLVVVNVATGLTVAASGALPRRLLAAIPAAAALVLIARGASPAWGRAWDQKYFATYTNNARSLETPEQRRERLSDVDVLYYSEGVNETVSVIRPKGSFQTFIVNGRPEASTALMDVQLQRTLGHLPMLLHPDPRRVFVLGTGTGMTLGAASIHPEVERLVLGEIEAEMLGVARSFSRWNSNVLGNPRLEVVLNDGRNFLATTRERFDVISADPVHPWSGGAGYLYTREYFRSVAEHLAPGGIACQWLPLYELSVQDIRTVVRTFADAFPHVLVWLTYYDAVLVGSETPIAIDPAAIAQRLQVPAIRDDLAPIQMATADDLLSFFLMGTSGARAFGSGGKLNTDDNLELEFSAPASQGIPGLDARNILALAEERESLAPYLVPGSETAGGGPDRWARALEAGRVFDRAHAAFLVDRESPGTARLLATVRALDPGYAPFRFLLAEQEFWRRGEPALVSEARFEVRTAAGDRGVLRIAGVRQFVGRERVLVSIVDSARREIYAQRYLDGEYDRLEDDARQYVTEALAALRSAAAHVPSRGGGGAGSESETVAALRSEASRLSGDRPATAGR